MRFRAPLILISFALISVAFPHAAHASVPYFGPIVPQEAMQGVCAAGWGMVIVVINNLISFLITVAIIFVAPLMIAYAGFLFVVNPFNSGGIEKAKGILTNTIVGIVIALAGYLIVDAVMAALYNAGAQTGNGTLGTWAALIDWNTPTCLPQLGSLPGGTLNPTTAGVNAIYGTLKGPPAGSTGTACDPSVILAGAAAGGYTLTPTQANVLACVARPESACGSNLQNYNWGKGSSAYGAFQVLLSTNSSCYENAACYSAAGVTGSLNCASGFSGGNPIPGSPVVQLCKKAASDINCSAAAAACLLQKSGGSFSPWQADINSSAQTSCLNQA